MAGYTPPYPNAATDPFNQVPGMNQSNKEAAPMADIEQLQAENERLRAEVEAGDRNLAAAMSAVAALEAQAGRLAEALRGMLDVAEESFANRTYVPINCPQVAKAYAELAQEDSNG